MSDVFSIVANAYYPDQMARVQQGAEAGTTVEPPVCPECEGAGLVGFWREPRNCETCDGTGYERGDTASLIASCRDTDEDVEPSQEILLALLREETMSYRRQQIANRWERIG